jgi:hypothetical protein
MTTIKARLAYALRLRERPDPGRRGGSGSCSSHGSVTMQIDWMTRDELDVAIRPIGPAFTAKVCLRHRARAP